MRDSFGSQISCTCRESDHKPLDDAWRAGSRRWRAAMLSSSDECDVEKQDTENLHDGEGFSALVAVD
eukprot:2775391-Amphidinium_carterae.1